MAISLSMYVYRRYFVGLRERPNLYTEMPWICRACRCSVRRCKLPSCSVWTLKQHYMTCTCWYNVAVTFLDRCAVGVSTCFRSYVRAWRAWRTRWASTPPSHCSLRPGATQTSAMPKKCSTVLASKQVTYYVRVMAARVICCTHWL